MKAPIIGPDGFCVIGIHIGCENPKDVSANLEYLFPGILLARIVSLTLEKLDMAAPDDAAAFMGTIFDGCITVKASRCFEAIDALKSELETCLLSPNIKIGFIAEAPAKPIGFSWQCVYPSPAINLEYLLNRERHELAFARQMDALKAAQKPI